MVEIAVVVVERFAVVGGENNKGVFGKSQRVQLFQNALDAGVHVGNRGFVQGDDEILVGAAERKPGDEIVPEGLEVIHRLQRHVVRIEAVLLVEHLVEGLRRQVGRMGVHVAHEKKKGLSSPARRSSSGIAARFMFSALWAKPSPEALQPHS